MTHPEDSESGRQISEGATLEIESGESVQGVIDFDGPDDMSNPENWTPVYKWTVVILISLMTLTA